MTKLSLLETIWKGSGKQYQLKAYFYAIAIDNLFEKLLNSKIYSYVQKYNPLRENNLVFVKITLPYMRSATCMTPY